MKVHPLKFENFRAHLFLNTDYINVIAPHNNIKTNTKLDLYKYNTNFIEYNKRIELLNTIHEYITNIVGAFANISDITIVLGEQLEHVNIFKIDNVLLEDSSPMCSLRISITASNKKGKSARSSSAGSGRFSIIKIMDSWKLHADHAIHEIRVNLEAVDAFAGLMTVVLGAGTPGIMIHEAVGHGLEADFNRKGTSVFSGKIGEKIAHEKVTIVDNATIPEKRGSKNFDDEGTISQNTILIENGILKGYMYDTLNASLMHKESTGNGRRESYAHIPYPRMTNTYMLAGSDSKEDIIKSVKKGIYIKSLSSGQVDITSGQFVFSTSEAYAIENGIITYPVKGVTLIGSGSEVLKNVSMVGNDFELYTGAGMCGKNGQSVPVGVGQPTIKVDNITVGGTNI